MAAIAKSWGANTYYKLENRVATRDQGKVFCPCLHPGRQERTNHAQYSPARR